MTILTQLEARISNNRIFGEVKDFKPILTYLSVSDANAGVLKSSITEVTMILRPLLNDFLAKGLSISVIHGVQFQDPIIQSHDRYIAVATNVAYVGWSWKFSEQESMILIFLQFVNIKKMFNYE